MPFGIIGALDGAWLGEEDTVLVGMSHFRDGVMFLYQWKIMVDGKHIPITGLGIDYIGEWDL